MSLSTAKKILEKSVLDALEYSVQMAKNAGEEDVSAQIRKKLAADLTNAIDAYVKSAQVNITMVSTVVPAGVAVATTGTPAAQTGTTVSPGTAQHTGFGKLQ